jgi:periplasmic copper chaperone A
LRAFAAQGTVDGSRHQRYHGGRFLVGEANMNRLVLGFAAFIGSVGLLVAAAVAGAAQAQNAASGIVVSNPTARFSSVPGRGGAGYMLVTGGAKADRLVNASSPVAGRVEIHTHVKQGDIMRMTKVDGVDVPAKGQVTFQPGGLHLMFFDVKTPPKPGESVPVTLTFKSGSSVTARFSAMSLAAPVRDQKGAAQATSQPKHDGHHHH